MSKRKRGGETKHFEEEEQHSKRLCSAKPRPYSIEDFRVARTNCQGSSSKPLLDRGNTKLPNFRTLMASLAVPVPIQTIMPLPDPANTKLPNFRTLMASLAPPVAIPTSISSPLSTGARNSVYSFRELPSNQDTTHSPLAHFSQPLQNGAGKFQPPLQTPTWKKEISSDRTHRISTKNTALPTTAPLEQTYCGSSVLRYSSAKSKEYNEPSIHCPIVLPHALGRVPTENPKSVSQGEREKGKRNLNEKSTPPVPRRDYIGSLASADKLKAQNSQEPFGAPMQPVASFRKGSSLVIEKASRVQYGCPIPKINFPFGDVSAAQLQTENNDEDIAPRAQQDTHILQTSTAMVNGNVNVPSERLVLSKKCTRHISSAEGTSPDNLQFLSGVLEQLDKSMVQGSRMNNNGNSNAHSNLPLSHGHYTSLIVTPAHSPNENSQNCTEAQKQDHILISQTSNTMVNEKFSVPSMHHLPPNNYTRHMVLSKVPCKNNRQVQVDKSIPQGPTMNNSGNYNNHGNLLPTHVQCTSLIASPAQPYIYNGNQKQNYMCIPPTSNAVVNGKFSVPSIRLPPPGKCTRHMALENGPSPNSRQVLPGDRTKMSEAVLQHYRMNSNGNVNTHANRTISPKLPATRLISGARPPIGNSQRHSRARSQYNSSVPQASNATVNGNSGLPSMRLLPPSKCTRHMALENGPSPNSRQVLPGDRTKMSEAVLQHSRMNNNGNVNTHANRTISPKLPATRLISGARPPIGNSQRHSRARYQYNSSVPQASNETVNGNSGLPSMRLLPPSKCTRHMALENGPSPNSRQVLPGDRTKINEAVLQHYRKNNNGNVNTHANRFISPKLPATRLISGTRPPIGNSQRHSRARYQYNSSVPQASNATVNGNSGLPSMRLLPPSKCTRHMALENGPSPNSRQVLPGDRTKMSEAVLQHSRMNNNGNVNTHSNRTISPKLPATRLISGARPPIGNSQRHSRARSQYNSSVE